MDLSIVLTLYKLDMATPHNSHHISPNDLLASPAYQSTKAPPSIYHKVHLPSIPISINLPCCSEKSSLHLTTPPAQYACCADGSLAPLGPVGDSRNQSGPALRDESNVQILQDLYVVICIYLLGCGGISMQHLRVRQGESWVALVSIRLQRRGRWKRRGSCR